MEVIREAKSVCPKCIKTINGEIVREGNRIYLCKKCAEHGKFKVLISNDASHYIKLNRIYFSLKHRNKKPDWLHCDISRIPLSRLKEYLKHVRNTKIYLTAGEPCTKNDLRNRNKDPTMQKELVQAIKLIKQSNNIPVLFTDGIKLADIRYLKELKNNGLEQVHLEFDGFDDDVYVKLRGKKLLEIKKQALKNLKSVNMQTSLEVTIAPGINEVEVGDILNLGVRNRNIRAIFFKLYNFFDNHRLTTEDLLDVVEKQTKGRIRKQEVGDFQKLLYVFNNIVASQRCFYNQYFPIFRERRKYISASQLIRLHEIQGMLHNFIKIGNRWIRILYFFLNLPRFVRPKSVLVLNKMIILGFVTICDLYTYDNQSSNCAGGEITRDGIFYPLVAVNLARSRKKNV